MRLAVPLLAFALFVLAAYMPSPNTSPSKALASQMSPDWENLQVLPDTLSRDALFDIMKGFTRALGVRCEHCHINEGEDNAFADFNFPSDDNPHKEVARDMMRMTWQINTEILPAIEGLGHHGPPKVTCNTCHRGSPHPGMEMNHEGMDHDSEEHHNGDDHDG